MRLFPSHGLKTTRGGGSGSARKRTHMTEEEPDVNYVQKIRFPWKWIGQDVKLLEPEVGGDWPGATVGVEG